ncbi:MBL fold metallo-hydrolase [Furfurilactobacillus sp. WILCCON 0119]
MAFKIYHINCGFVQGLQYEGEALVMHCLLIDTGKDGLVLVDTGLGRKDQLNAEPRLGFAFTHIYAKPQQGNIALAAVEQIKALGYDPRDVRNIVMTHLDLDHAGGLVDFPNATVHVFQTEWETAMSERGFKTSHRYRQSMWQYGPNWHTYNEVGDNWKGFNHVQQLTGLPPEILLIPTAGHSRGHCAVAIDTGDDGWLVHAGDTYFDPHEVHNQTPSMAPQLARFERFNQWNQTQRLENVNALRNLILTDQNVHVFCAHNPAELHDWVKQNPTKTLR